MSLFFTCCFAVLGAVLGSFIGVVAERAYTGQSWKKGRSRCNSCREDLGALDLIPVFSWVMHRGRCRKCGSNIPGAYALYELSLGVAFALAYHMLGLSLALAAFLAALLILAFIVIYDLRHTIVPVPASTALILACAAFAAIASPSLAALGFTVLRAFGVGLFFFLLHALSRGRAMGLGDTPVSFALALLAGPLAIAGLMFSFWIGAVIGICILVFRKGGPTMGIEVPFVPFMALGFLLAIFTQWNPLPF
jgi:prepilin signal peptidase PulO-like enzyme (type II secretory pathway)